MSKYRKKSIVIEATRWFKNGDHPKVHRFPTLYSETRCHRCEKPLLEHGVMHAMAGRSTMYTICPNNYVHFAGKRLRSTMCTVCPGDYIVTETPGGSYPCRAEIFEATYDISNE